MSETVRQMVVRMSMDAGGFTKTAGIIKGQISNLNRELKGMGDNVSADKLREKLSLQQSAVENLAKQVAQAKTNFENASTAADQLAKARQYANLESALEQAKTAAAQTAEELRKLDAMKFTQLGNTLTKYGKNLQTFGRSFSLYIGGPLALLGGKAYKDALQYETAMADLGIATETTGEELEAVNQQVLAMSETIPMSYKELAALTATLARAGVPAEELERVTRVLAGLGATTDVSAEQSAAAMIKFMNVMGIPLSQVEQFASSLVALGNAGVSTGSEIFEMAQRMSATGNLAGLSGVEVLGLASAFASLGINAEAGGTSASKLMKAMQLAAETGKGLNDVTKSNGEVVMGFTTAMGMTEEQFKESWGRDQVGTMLAFFDALKGSAETGGDGVLAMLDAMEMTEVRLSNLIGVGASNPDFFREMLGLGRDAWVDNTALAKGVEVAYGTAQAAQDVALNKMENASADVGENIVDLVQPIIKVVADMVGEFGKLDEETQSRWVKVAGALVLLGPAAKGIGLAVEGAGTLIGWIGKLKAGEAEGFTKVINSLTSVGAGGWMVIAGGLVAAGLYLESMYNETAGIQRQLSNITIELDEESYARTKSSLAELKAQADALAGEQGEHNKNVSAAVKAGYGTADMYGTALGYEARFTQAQMASIAGKYAEEIDKLNGMIGAETDAVQQKALANQRDAMQAQWDAEVSAARANYMAQVSALVSGMMSAQPEAKAALERAAKDYDLLAIIDGIEAEALTKGSGSEMIEVYKKLLSPEIMDRFFQGNFEDLIGMDPSKASMYAGMLKSSLITSLADAMTTAGGEDSLAYTLLQSILDDPLAAGYFDQTKTEGALDGLVEALDFKNAGEGAGKDFANKLTPGLADAIEGATAPAMEKLGTLGETLSNESARQGAAAGAAYSAAFNANLKLALPGVGGASGYDAYKVRRDLNDITLRMTRGYGKG